MNPSTGGTGQRKIVSRNSGDGGSRQGRERCLGGATDGSSRQLGDQWHQREQPEWGEHGPGQEQQSPAGVPPGHGDPAEREQSVQDRGTLGDVAERKERSGQSDREAGARHPPGGECGEERDGDDERGWPERKQRRSERSAQRSQPHRSETASEIPWAGRGSWQLPACRVRA